MEKEVVGRRISPICLMQTTELFLFNSGDRDVLDWLWKGSWHLRETGSALSLSSGVVCSRLLSKCLCPECKNKGRL